MNKDLLPGAGVLAVVLSLAAGGAAGANRSDGWNDCAKIADDAQRLRCLDDRAGRSPEAGTAWWRTSEQLEWSFPLIR